uniref:Uncharacterized protein n=1 Tax=Peronospora matthiolae TaxID=2874970 RepID=A0AAV1TKE9_9STRA
MEWEPAERSWDEDRSYGWHRWDYSRKYLIQSERFRAAKGTAIVGPRSGDRNLAWTMP